MKIFLFWMLSANMYVAASFAVTTTSSFIGCILMAGINLTMGILTHKRESNKEAIE